MQTFSEKVFQLIYFNIYQTLLRGKKYKFRSEERCGQSSIDVGNIWLLQQQSRQCYFIFKCLSNQLR